MRASAADGAPSSCTGGAPPADRKVAYLKRRPGYPACWLPGQRVSAASGSAASASCSAASRPFRAC